MSLKEANSWRLGRGEDLSPLSPLYDPATLLLKSGELRGYYEHYLLRVLRLRAGDKLKVFPAPGRSHLRAYVEVELRDHLLVPIAYYEEKIPAPPLSETRVLIPLIKGEGMERVLGAVVQLGVGYIVIFQAERSVRKLKDRINTRFEKLILRESMASRRWFLPLIAIFPSLSIALSSVSDLKDTFIIYLDPQGERLHRLADRFEEEILESGAFTVLFGPEGGLTPEEEALLRERKVIKVSLGNLILRSELAPIVFLSQLSYILELKGIRGRGR